jgi:hypothetical protein
VDKNQQIKFNWNPKQQLVSLSTCSIHGCIFTLQSHCYPIPLQVNFSHPWQSSEVFLRGNTQKQKAADYRLVVL